MSVNSFSVPPWWCEYHLFFNKTVKYKYDMFELPKPMIFCNLSLFTSSINRPKTTSEVYQKCQKKICTLFSPKLAQMVCEDLWSPVNLPVGSTKFHHADFEMLMCTAAVCVLEKMLLLDPERRVGASEALDLPFFSEFRDAEEETEALPYEQTMDDTDLPLDQQKRKREGGGLSGFRAALINIFISTKSQRTV